MYKKFPLSRRLVHIVCIASILLLYAVFVPTSEANDDMTWGVTYSPSQATYLNLDPKEVYRSIISELGAKHIKLHVNWNAIEKNNDQFYFKDLDYYVRYANRNNVELILVVGMKTGRWPECHTPNWMKRVAPEKRDDEILEYLTTIVERYKRVPALKYWHIENEPFYKFGTCPNWYYEYDTSLLESEIKLLKELDPSRKIIVSEPGELSDWTKAAQLADIVGITMYRSNWSSTTETFGDSTYAFLPPSFYQTKATFINSVYQKTVMSIELQSEPWPTVPLRDASLSEQAQTMNPEFFRESIDLATQSGITTYYFWGAEWWYWMKTKHNQPAIWNQAKTLIEESQ
jgi:Glycosyl hydrolase family 10